MGVYYLQEEVVFVPFFTLGGTSTDLASNLSIITQQASGEMQGGLNESNSRVESLEHHE